MALDLISGSPSDQALSRMVASSDVPLYVPAGMTGGRSWPSLPVAVGSMSWPPDLPKRADVLLQSLFLDAVAAFDRLAFAGLMWFGELGESHLTRSLELQELPLGRAQLVHDVPLPTGVQLLRRPFSWFECAPGEVEPE